MLALFITLVIATTFQVNTETKLVFNPETGMLVKKPLEFVIRRQDPPNPLRNMVEIEKQTSGCDIKSVNLDVIELNARKLLNHKAVELSSSFELEKGVDYQIVLPVPFNECGSWWGAALEVKLEATKPFLVRACTDSYFVRTFPKKEIFETKFTANFEECGDTSLIITPQETTTLKVSL